MNKLIAALSICIVPAFAAPACVSGTYASYVALAGGCSIGDATFTNFSNFGFVNSAGVPDLTTSEVMVVPSGNSGLAELTFVYLNGQGNPTPVTVNSFGQIFSFGFTYNIIVSNPSQLAAIEMDSMFSNTSPGSASATKSAAQGGASTAVSDVSDEGTSNPMGLYLGNLAPVSGNPQGTYLITDTTSLQAQDGGSVTQSSFNNDFVLLAPRQTSDTPEVGSYAMIGSGLVFLGLFANTTRKRRLNN